MIELDNVLSNNTPREIVLMTKKDFSINDSYFEFDGYGNLKSYETIEELLNLYHDVQG